MQNMKLIDLETGQYLELEEDWLYGGRAIHILSKNSTGYYYYRQSEPPEPLKTPCEKTGAVVYGGRYVLMNEIDVWVYNNDLQPKKIKTGDVIKEQTSYLDRKYTVINVSDFFLDTTEGIKTTHKLGKKTFSKYDFFAIEKNFGNIFEEYPKQLRNEPNKFNELIELLK